MKFVPSTAPDIEKYYRGSYLKFKETGDILFLVKNVNREMISGVVSDGRDFKLFLDEEQPYEVEYNLPHKSFFQYGDKAVQLQRIPARQFHRGITQENTQLVYKSMGNAGYAFIDLGFDPLLSYVTKQAFSSLSEAVKKGPEIHSVALSPRMMFFGKTNTIYIDMLAIARLSPKKDAIQLHHNVFRDEVADLLKSHGELDLFKLYNSDHKVVKNVNANPARELAF